jgi:hypothetical protein
VVYIYNCIAFSEEGSPTLKEVLTFLTGCDSVPSLGWNCPASIIFTDTDGLPEVSTCTLTFFLSIKLPQEFVQFKDKFNLSILGSQSIFGKV